MSIAEQELVALGRARAKKEVAERDYQRALAKAAVHHTQRELARTLGLSQPSISSALKTARLVPMPAEGLESASPYEVCQRYAAGELTREETIAQLIDWPYATSIPMRTSPGDDVMLIPEGTTQDLIIAKMDGLIDRELCHQVLDAIYGDE